MLQHVETRWMLIRVALWQVVCRRVARCHTRCHLETRLPRGAISGTCQNGQVSRCNDETTRKATRQSLYRFTFSVHREPLNSSNFVKSGSGSAQILTDLYEQFTRECTTLHVCLVPLADFGCVCSSIERNPHVKKGRRTELEGPGKGG